MARKTMIGVLSVISLTLLGVALVSCVKQLQFEYDLERAPIGQKQKFGEYAGERVRLRVRNGALSVSHSITFVPSGPTRYPSPNAAPPWRVVGLIRFSQAIAVGCGENYEEYTIDSEWTATLWTVMAGLAAYPVVTLTRRFFRRRRRSRTGRCLSCGYDLAYNVSGVCPECGDPLEEAGVQMNV